MSQGNDMSIVFRNLPVGVMAKAVNEHREYLRNNPHKRVVCDDTITPFSSAMSSQGYKPVVTSSGCTVLSQCIHDDCRKLYSTLYEKDSVQYLGCPHCQRITKK